MVGINRRPILGGHGGNPPLTCLVWSHIDQGGRNSATDQSGGALAAVQALAPIFCPGDGLGADQALVNMPEL